MKKKVLIIAAAVLVVAAAAGAAFFFLRGDSGPKVKSPDAYTIGEESTRPLDAYLGEAGALVSAQVLTAEGEEGEEPTEAESKPQEPTGDGKTYQKNWDKTGQKPKEPVQTAEENVQEGEAEQVQATPAVDDGRSIKERQKEEKKARKEAEKAAKKAEKEAEKEAKKAAKEAEKAAKNATSSFNAKETSKGVDNPHAGERLAALMPAPLPGEEEASAEEKAAEEAAAQEALLNQVLVYTYSGIGADTINNYAAALCSSDEGFVLVSDSWRPLDIQQTNYSDTQVPGELILARNATSEAADGRVFQIKLSWGQGNCTAEVSCPEGKILDEDMSIQDEAGYLETLSPSELGLSGDSMDDYRIYPQEGTVLIDGKVYRKFTVYSIDPNTKTNKFEGSFLVDGHKLFKLDQFNGTVTPLN